jgi:hypothetical protein
MLMQEVKLLLLNQHRRVVLIRDFRFDYWKTFFAFASALLGR